MTLGIAPAMAKEHLLTAESKGKLLHNLNLKFLWKLLRSKLLLHMLAGILCRDISPDGFRFFINLFPEIDPNGVYS